MTDIEIASNTKLNNIVDIAGSLGIKEDEIELYGKYKAKISSECLKRIASNQDGKLILVTSINPTPLGEGKTTMSISIADGLRKIGKKSILALREPSLGPVFGIKGGATGGGHAQVAPMTDINLHFTGDIHAITSANNLLASMIDNHIYFGNELGFKKVVFKRCVDLNDRALRKVEVGLSGEKNLEPRIDSFDISVASEVMAILCLSKDIFDLKTRLGNILVGYNTLDEPIFAKDLKAEGSMAVLLKDALKPNLVQTLEHTPAIIHGGPFANIAHGCNSIIATNAALKLADYTITEAGFGADLGAEKFLDIKCRKLDKTPDVTILVVTLKGLKYHGGSSKEDVFIKNIDYLSKGLNNLYKHYSNLKDVYGLNTIVAINKYNQDNEEELNYLEEELAKHNIIYSVVDSYNLGGDGAIDIAQKIVNLDEENNFKYVYDLEDSIEDKIKKVAHKIYGAKNVVFSDNATKSIANINKMGYSKYPVCIAKTQYSLSDDAKNLECKEDFDIHVTELEVKTGCEFIVVKTGNIMTMPGLPKMPAAENIGVDENENIVGIF